MKDVYLYIVAGLALGCMIPVQSAINSQLGQQLKHPLQASFISFSVGTLVLAVILSVFKIGFPFTKHLCSISWYLFLGGAMGAVFVSAIIVLVPKTGTLRLLATTVAGELLLATIADHYGWFGLPVHQLSISRAVGVLFLLAGLYFVHK